MSADHPNPRDITAKGETIYTSKYRSEYELRYLGQFAAIDIGTENAYVGEFPEAALAKARAASRSGIFYLVRIGSPGAFKISGLSRALDTRSPMKRSWQAYHASPSTETTVLRAMNAFIAGSAALSAFSDGSE